MIPIPQVTLYNKDLMTNNEFSRASELHLNATKKFMEQQKQASQYSQ